MYQEFSCGGVEKSAFDIFGGLIHSLLTFYEASSRSQQKVGEKYVGLSSCAENFDSISMVKI